MPYLALVVLVVVVVVFGAALLFTRTRIGDWVNEWVVRGEPRRLQDPIYALLRREVQLLGQEFEVLPYGRLLELDDSLAYSSKVIDGVEIDFNTELVSVYWQRADSSGTSRRFLKRVAALDEACRLVIERVTALMRDSGLQPTLKTNPSVPARVIRIAVILIVGLPDSAFAHGEQILVFPAATVVLILLTSIALLGWGEDRRHKLLLVATLFGVHALLWFVPLTIAELADVAGRMFLALIALPLGAAAAVHVVVRGRRRRGDRNEAA